MCAWSGHASAAAECRRRCCLKMLLSKSAVTPAGCCCQSVACALCRVQWRALWRACRCRCRVPWHGVARALWSGHAGALWSGCVDRVACGVWSGQWCARFWSDLGRFGAGLLVRCCRVLLSEWPVRFAAGLLVPLQGCGRCRVHTTVQGQDCLHLRNFCCQNAVCAMKFGSWCGCRGGGRGISMAMWALGPGEDYVNAVAKTASAWLPPKNSFCLHTYPHISA